MKVLYWMTSLKRQTYSLSTRPTPLKTQNQTTKLSISIKRQSQRNFFPQFYFKKRIHMSPSKARSHQYIAKLYQQMIKLKIMYHSNNNSKRSGLFQKRAKVYTRFLKKRQTRESSTRIGTFCGQYWFKTTFKYRKASMKACSVTKSNWKSSINSNPTLRMQRSFNLTKFLGPL